MVKYLYPDESNTCNVCNIEYNKRGELRISSCRRVDHVVCIYCLYRYAELYVSVPGSLPNQYITPQFSFSSTRTPSCQLTCIGASGCAGIYSNSVWVDVLRQNELLLNNVLTKIRQNIIENPVATEICNICNSVSHVNKQGLTKCIGCGTSKCVWCLDLQCKEGNYCSHSTIYEPNRFMNGKRKLFITSNDISYIKSRIMDQSGVVRVHCPVCDVLLQKTSACNELHHCGRAICYVCGASSLPWEPAHLPSHHWAHENDTLSSPRCARFDSHSMWSACGYMCTSACVGVNEADCVNQTHQSGIFSMNMARRDIMLDRLIKSI